MQEPVGVSTGQCQCFKQGALLNGLLRFTEVRKKSAPANQRHCHGEKKPACENGGGAANQGQFLAKARSECIILQYFHSGNTFKLVG
jgi:hypothetical protein